MTDTPREPHGDARRLLVEKAREAVRVYNEVIEFFDCSDDKPSAPHFSGLTSADYTRLEDAMNELEAALSTEAVLSAPHREMSDAEAVEWLELIDLDGYRTSIKIAMQVAIARLRPAEAVPSAPAGLRAAVQTVLDTFRRDEAQGYSSRDKQFAINILADALSRAEDTP